MSTSYILGNICIIFASFFLTTDLLLVEILTKAKNNFWCLCSYRFKSPKLCVAVGGSISPGVTEDWKHITKLNIYEGYGKTATVGWCWFTIQPETKLVHSLCTHILRALAHTRNAELDLTHGKRNCFNLKGPLPAFHCKTKNYKYR